MATHIAGASQSNSTVAEKRQFKLVLLGESAVGKTSLILPDANEKTLGASLVTKNVRLGDETKVKFEIWDTAGQERYRSLAPMYYRHAQAALVVYDITDQRSFKKARSWVKELRRQVVHDIVIVLLGNKVDLCADRFVEFDEGQDYAQANNLMFMETSAKTGHNVDRVFLEIAQRLNSKERTNSRREDIEQGLNLADEKRREKMKKMKNKCC
ncbi:hypothetical protein L596_008958 [Steinernema carpocapsae]|uniref:Uncharacterized protein n=1 Tax=Steinernema carpocapsae TaxID=34508 RepID=A0A4U5PE78_STECR|nr:hypothetical protein L596_008958 [Steinernema carpocapsae]